MFSSLEDFENSTAFVVFFIVAFPLLFAAIWCFVIWITTFMSGWRDLARCYPYDGQEVLEWQYRGAGGVNRAALPYAGLRTRLAVGAAHHGIVIKAPFIMAPFSQTLFLPFDHIETETERKFLFLDLVLITLRETPQIRISMLKSANEMVERHRLSQSRCIPTP